LELFPESLEYRHTGNICKRITYGDSKIVPITFFANLRREVFVSSRISSNKRTGTTLRLNWFTQFQGRILYFFVSASPKFQALFPPFWLVLSEASIACCEVQSKHSPSKFGS